MTLTEQIISGARGWIGTPYHHGARVKGAGCDCLMLLVDVYQSVGLLPADLVIPRYSAQIMFHNPATDYLDAVLTYCTETPGPVLGGVVMWRYGKTFSHSGLITRVQGGEPVVVHAYAPFKQVLEMPITEDNRLMRRERRYFVPDGLQEAIA